MTISNRTRTKDLLNRCVHIGGEIAVQRGSFTKAHGEMSPMEKQVFDLLETIVTDVAIRLRSYVEEMDEAAYQEQQGNM